MTIRAIHEWSSNINRTAFMRFGARELKTAQVP